MKTATVSALRSRMRNYLNQNEPILVTQNGHPKALLFPVMEEDDVERLLMANNKELMTLLNAADRRISHSGGVPHGKFWARLGRRTKRSQGTF